MNAGGMVSLSELLAGPTAYRKRFAPAPKDALDDVEAIIHAAKIRLKSYVA